MGERSSAGPLAGVRVLELGQLIAGPFCGQLLGDMGAEVVKVEPPRSDTRRGGDPMRDWGQGEVPTWWRVIARNKLSISLDLSDPHDRETARALAARADILIENFRPGTLEQWGMAPETLMAANPRLIMVRVSGYGQTGPYAQRAGFGGIGEAMGGWRAIVGEPDRPPARMGVSIGDSLAATYGCMGALAALHERATSGLGQVIDVSLYESVLQVMESLVPEQSVNGHARRRTGSILPGIAPSNVYPCSDGEYLIGANGDAIFARLAAAMGRPELARDERYGTHLARGANQRALDELIGAWTRTLTVDALEALMIANAIPAGRIFGAADMLTDPHFAAREAIVRVPDTELGEVAMQATFPKFSRTPGGVRRAAPLEIGQDGADVRARWLGEAQEAAA